MKAEFPSEKAIEDYVWSKLQAGDCCPISNDRHDFFLRQKEIKGYGVTDIIKICVAGREVTITVLELKNEPIKEAHISQLCRYMVGIKRAVELYRRKVKDCPFVEVRGEIAGPFNKDRGDVLWLTEQLKDIDVYDLSIDLDIGFKSTYITPGWFRTNEDRLAYKDVVRAISNCLAEEEMLALGYQSYIGEGGENVVSIKGDRDA